MRAAARRLFHGSASRRAITQFQMPAMSPTMTEGGIASWKKQEGESFAQGDVLLEIETDKATIDVEAQEDGIMGKILASEGTKNVPVGKLIALLAEEGDDLSNLEVPKEDVTQPPTPPKGSSSPKSSSSSSVPLTQSSTEGHLHSMLETSRPLFPSVHRLFLEHNITNVGDIKGTGVRGMITKGDVLTFLGKASGPLGTFKFGPSPFEEASKNGAGKYSVTPSKEPLDGPAIRRLIVTSMLQSSQKPSNTSFKNADFNSIISDYLPPNTKHSPPIRHSPPESDFLNGLY